MPALKKSIRSYSVKKRWTGSNSLDRINQSRRVHALKFTATGGPDGILQNLGVVAGRRHDRIGLRNSRINTKLENAQNNRGVPALLA